MKRILILALAALIAFATAADAATPRKATTAYDGLRISGASEQLIDWQALRSDAAVKYIYLDVPASAIEAAHVKARKTLGLPADSEADAAVEAAGALVDSMLVRNMRAAREAGFEVGLCYAFADTLSKVFIIRTMLRNIPARHSSIAPMIAIPTGESLDRTLMHRRLQVWCNALEKSHGRKPILMATREACKAYLAPVLSTIYPICLIHPEGPGMRQYPNAYTGPLKALPEDTTAGAATAAGPGDAASAGSTNSGSGAPLSAFPLWSAPE